MSCINNVKNYLPDVWRGPGLEARVQTVIMILKN